MTKEQITQPIRRDIVLGLRNGDKTQATLRKEIGIDQNNRSKLQYHLKYLQGKRNSEFEENPLIEKYREDGQKLYTLKNSKIDLGYKQELLTPYIGITMLQVAISFVIWNSINYTAYFWYLASSFSTFALVTVHTISSNTMREVFYTPVEDHNKDKNWKSEIF